MPYNRIDMFKRTIIFGVEQLNIYLETKKEDFEKNSNYKNSNESVYRENLVVYEEEVLYISRTLDIIKKYDVSKYDSVESFKAQLLIDIKNYYHTHGVPMVCFVIISEKIESCYQFYNSIFKD